MTEIITAILILICLVLIGVQGQKLTQQQSQIELLRETLTEYMFNMTKFVQAQNDANEAVINMFEKDEEYIQNSSRDITALAAHVQFLDNEVQKKCKGEYND